MDHRPLEEHRDDQVTFVRACLMLLACGLARPSAAEDTDIFSPRADFDPGIPTIIFVLDNTANWSRQSNGWPSGTQGAAEMNAIASVVARPRKAGQHRPDDVHHQDQHQQQQRASMAPTCVSRRGRC